MMARRLGQSISKTAAGGSQSAEVSIYQYAIQGRNSGDPGHVRLAPSGVQWSPCLDGSGLFWQQNVGQHNITQVYRMFCLIGL